MFSAVFVFQKSYTGNILEIGQNESQSSYLLDTKESKGETESSQEAAAPKGGAGHHLAAPPGGVGPSAPL
jgi:hypothetical protein